MTDPKSDFPRLRRVDAGAPFLWAAVIAWSCAAGLLMGFIGIIVVAPLLGHATWHAYRELVEAG